METIETAAGPARLQRSRRKTLAISVLPDGGLELVAPEGASLEPILARVQKRLPWIQRQRRRFVGLNTSRPALRYVTGATHRYLGRQYRLKLNLGDKPEATLRGAYLHVTTVKPEVQDIRDAIDVWYRQQAIHQFNRRLAAWESWCLRHRLPQPKLRLRVMPKRWGSALPNGVICLNPELVRAPSACIDYVIAHEVCHLKHHHHGKTFYTELSTLCPNWQALKTRLESTEL